MRYFEKEHADTMSDLVDKGTPRRYVFIQIIKYLNLLNFYFKKLQFDLIPHKSVTENSFKATTFLALYLGIIENRPIRWIGSNVLPRKGNVFGQDFAKKLHLAKTLELAGLLEQYPALEQLSIRYAHPLFFIEKISTLIPEADLEKFLQAQNAQRYLYFRIMRNEVDVSQVRNYFHQTHVLIKKVKGLPFAFQFMRRNIKKVILSPPYARGDIALHDLASMEACVAVNAQPGERILDACAAPFMKTSLLHLITRGQGEILSVELSPARIRQSKSSPSTGKGIFLLNADSTYLPLRKQDEGILFDKVLLDAPCTSSGAIYYSPEMKWVQTSDYLRSHAELQKKLLQECLLYLKKGGILVYAVCSYYKEEGEEIIEHFADRVKIVSMRRFFAHVDKCQGFFMAILQRKS